MVKLNGSNLSRENYKRIVFDRESMQVDSAGMKNVKDSYEVINKIVKENMRVYGVTTGFGKLVEFAIDSKDIEKLQLNIIRSHSVGVGEPFPQDDVLGAILLRINTIIRGNSGVSPETLNTYIQMLNKGLIPFVPQKGSVGASGDLAPLSHIALAALGEGEILHNGKYVNALSVLKKNGIIPIKPKPKEGLALINGTQMMTAAGMNAAIYADRLIKTADIIAAISADALLSTTTAFESRIQQLRPHRGQAESAENIRNLMKGSAIRKSHIKCSKVQDPYSIRCIPQVHGAVREAYSYCINTLETEMNSSTDNPLVFIKEKEVVSGGNFHGEMVAIPMDTLKIAISELGNLSDRRTYRLIDPSQTGLKPFLAENPGLNSGFMMMQVTSAALVSENKVLAHPASVDSIPTSLGQEDHVSMGTIAARNLRSVVENSAYVLAVELFAGMTALRMRRPLRSSDAIESVEEHFFKKIKPIKGDRPFYRDLEKIKGMIMEGEILNKAAQAVKLK